MTDAWLCDDAVTVNGQNVWYLLTRDGAMPAAGLVQDNTGNFYSLETDHNGSFGAITNADGLEKLIAIYGITQYGIGNENSVYTAAF